MKHKKTSPFTSLLDIQKGQKNTSFKNTSSGTLEIKIQTLNQPSLLYQHLRKVLASLLLILPNHLRYRATSLLKKLKTTETKEQWLFKQKIVHPPQKDTNTWNGKRWVVCITHDIDYIEDYNAIPALVSLEKKYEIRSSWNFVTHDLYAINPTLPN